jgi:hypothetical protein
VCRSGAWPWQRRAYRSAAGTAPAFCFGAPRGSPASPGALTTRHIHATTLFNLSLLMALLLGTCGWDDSQRVMS